MQWFKRFLEKNGPSGLVMAVASIAYIILILLQGIFQAEFSHIFAQLTLPVDFAAFIKQPWSLLTYWLAIHPMAIWFLVIDLAILYTFGNILNALIGDRLIQGIVIFALLVNAIIVMTVCSILPTVELTETAHLGGLHLLNCTLIGAAITLAPHYKFEIIRWRVDLLWIGLFLLLIPLVAFRAVFTVSGVATIVGALMGFGMIRLRQSGLDITIWAQLRMRKQEERRQPVIINMRQSRESKPGATIQVKPKGKSKGRSDAEELDYLLDKINEVGVNGLSGKEKETLDRLSKD